ncbi:MAG: translation initiation factor IF-2 [Defluviitaleaceae bacterium]|nr:translation initiation factor IF-2 [Defluviitaleaceae bacterium]
MPKMRVHEIAKQLNVNSKVLLDKLVSMGIDAKNHMSTVEEGDAQRVLGMYSGKRPDKSTNEQKAEPVAAQSMAERMAAERAAAAEIKAIEAEKARKIAEKAAKIEAKAAAKAAAKEAEAVAVKAAEMEAAKIEREKKDLEEKQRAEAAAKAAIPAAATPPEHRPRPDADRPRPPRPDGERPQRPDGERPPRPDGMRPRPPRPDGERPPRPPRPDGERPRFDGDRPRPPRTEGDRPPRHPRPDGERPVRHEGDRPPHYNSDRPRPPRQDGDRPPYQGDRPRPPRQDGSRPPYQGDRPRPPRQDGDRPPYQGDRPRPPRQDGDRPPYQGDRPRPPRQDGSRPPYNSDRPRPPRQDGDRPPYQGDRPRPPRQDGSRPPYRSDGQKPFDGQRREGGFQRDGNTGWQGKPGGGRPGGFRGSRDSGPVDKAKLFSAPPDPVAAKVTKSPSRLAQKSAKKGKDDVGGGYGAKGAKGKPEFQHKSLAKAQPTKGKKKKDKHKFVEAELPKEDILIETDTDGEVLFAVIPKSIKVKDFAEKINKPTAEIIKHLMKRGILANLNQEVDFYVMSKVAEEYGITVERAEEEDILGEAFKDIHDKVDARHLKERPPVVVVMGHVDHGKTSLLDSIRKTNVMAGEAGGITQHIGAYTVSINNRHITFLDTPGHEAFTAMRLRGAQVTDVAIIVVAADDGVMPQTIEAIDHAKAADVDIIVAINKIDKPSANIDRVKQELTEYGLVAEDWGGTTVFAPVSAKMGDGIEDLLEMILLVADMKELQADPQKKARGTVIEALLDKGRGPVATVLVQDGTLRVGDPIVAGSTFGKVRAMMDDKGNKVIKAGPAIPVEILGLSEVPSAGDMFYVAQNEKQARSVAESMVAHGRRSLIKDTPQKVSLNDLFTQIQSGKVKDLNIVVKADVQGSVEAVKNSLERLSNDEVRVRIIHGGVGAINESDVMLASASNAIVIGFNVRPEASARTVAENEKVDIRMYRIIYNAIEDVTAAMKGMLDPEYEEKVLGQAEIRQIFKASGVGNIAGCHVTSGKILRNAQVRIFRDNVIVYDGSLDALKRFKDDAKEVTHGYECGMTFSKFGDIKEGDTVECYTMEQIPR